MPCPRCDPPHAEGTLPSPHRAHGSWALVGTPNVGKTSLINAVAGSRLSVGNWSGTTVDLARADTLVEGAPLTLVDLPGTYALAGTSAEEDSVLPALLANPAALIVNVVDAQHLARDLTLTLELSELGRPLVVVLNLLELANARGIELDPAPLEQALGVPVLALPDHRRHGAQALIGTAAHARVPSIRVPYPAAIEAALAAGPTRWHALARLSGELPGHAPPPPIGGLDPFLAIAEARHRLAQRLATAATGPRGARRDPSERVDRVILHPVLGPLALIAGLALTFHLTFALSTPWIDLLGLVQGVLAGWVAALPLPALLASFLAGALIEGVGTVVSFVPVLFTLYVLLGILENAGILARVAYLADGLMRAIGLPGRAVLPMVLSIGCTVPAIGATRTLDDPGDRLRVALAIPSIPCGARLPIFVLLAAAFLPAYAAVVVTGLYLLGFAVAILSALLFRRVLSSSEGSGAMELPSYRWPPASLVWRLAWARTRSFLQSAGGPILLVVIGIWALLEVTLPSGMSLFEQTARTIAPLFAPLGLDDWRIVGSLIPAAVAKEVAIGSLALTFGGAAEATAALGFGAGLHAIGSGVLEAARDTLTGLWGFGGGGDEVDGLLAARLAGGMGLSSAVALMVFMLLYMPCIATLAAIRKAFGTRWMLLSMVYQTTLAYAVALLVVLAWP
jgi:ferrous iron transport protein B